MKVTADPGQNGFEDAEMLIPAGRLVFTTIVIEFDWAGFPEMHVSDDNREQVITSLLAGE